MSQSKKHSKSLASEALLVFYRVSTFAVLAFVAYQVYVRSISSIFSTDDALLIPFILVWLMTAYIVLPRIHRILTKIYIPNYFIGRTRVADGFYGDPVNLAFNGSEKDLKKAFEKAGWTMAEPLTWRTSLKMAYSSVMRKSYKQAPVSSLYLFSRKQDFAFQQEINGNPHARHHVRFWRTPSKWYLPGGHKADWLAAGTYDRRVGFSLFTLQFTHKIGEDVDEERDYIIKTLKQAEAVKKLEVVKHFTTAFHSRNGGGDKIKTDGSMPFIDV